MHRKRPCTHKGKASTVDSSILSNVMVLRPEVVEETMFFIWEGDE
jgi:hypothetical protein